MEWFSQIKPLVISAPFGNYIQPDGCTATLGTFTALARPGRVWRVLKTVRYYRRPNAWVNKIGLRNPGIDWLVRQAKTGKVAVGDKLVSIHGFDEQQWYTLIDRIADLRPLGVELNMSCPNVGEIGWPKDLFERAVASGVPVVVKVPPVNYRLMFDAATASGVRVFHCCNTLPVPAGGMSGKPLKPVALQCIRDIRENLGGHFREDVKIIGGGGITLPEDVDAYAEAGADRFAVATKVFNPKYLFSHAGLRALIQRAGESAATD